MVCAGCVARWYCWHKREGPPLAHHTTTAPQTMQDRTLTTAQVVAGMLLTVAATFGAIAGARAIDAHLNVNACLTERAAAGLSFTSDCYDRGASF